ncbi:MAG TPA: hypothetical protein PKD12_11290 [Nitrospira sp.]|nr:hypothetical protein [Nitrospira sp.]
MGQVGWKIGWPSVMSLVLAVTVSGCGLTAKQKAALDSFAAATQEFSSSAQSEFQKNRQDVIEMNRVRFELGDEKVPLNELDRLLTRERVQTRLTALQTLEDYAGLLRKLVGAVPEGELLEAGHSFVSNLRSVKGVSFSDEQAEGIGKAVAAVGGLYVEYKRAHAVREVIETANQPILSVINLVKRDLDPNESGWSAGYKLTASKLEKHALTVGGPVPPQDFASKSLVFKAQAMAAERTTRFDLVSSELMGLASGVAEAQQNLLQVLNTSDFNAENVHQFAKKVREFKSIYGLLHN